MLLGIGAYKDREKYLTRVLEIANTLETMVQEILTISRLETAGADFKKDRLDCIQIIKFYLNETEDLIAGKDLQIHLDISLSLSISGNKMLMEKVFPTLSGMQSNIPRMGRTSGFLRCRNMGGQYSLLKTWENTYQQIVFRSCLMLSTV